MMGRGINTPSRISEGRPGGAAAINAAGDVVARARGTVPADWIQSSQSGEFAALAVTVQIITGVSRIFFDCANGVRDWSLPFTSGHLRKAYGNITRYTRGVPNAQWVQTVNWVKAHQNLRDLKGDADSRAQAKGSDAADAEAKAGRALHPAPAELQAKKVKRFCWHAIVACKTIAVTLPHWDRLPRHERAAGSSGTTTSTRGDTAR